MKKTKNIWTGNIHHSTNDRPNGSGGILILAKKGLDIIPKESGTDRDSMGRMAWEIYEIRGHKLLIMGIYGPPGGEDAQNASFFEEEVFEVLDNETYDNVIIAGDWNVFLDTEKDHKNYKNPGKYRTKTREEIKSKIRTHNLSDIYREQNPTTREFTYNDITDHNKSSRLDYFIVDQETAVNTISTKIEPITAPFDHSEITITIDFDKVTRGQGFWKFNNSHLDSENFKCMIRYELLNLVIENQSEEEHQSIAELRSLSPEERQKVKLILNPHELMEQIHYRLKKIIISYSIDIQRNRRKEKADTEQNIARLREELKSVTLGENQRLDKQDKLSGHETTLEKMEEHLAKGTSIRSRQEWDINAEGPGKILLKCEDRYGQQKYMSSITKKNERGEVTEKITGQQNIQDETTKYWRDMFADEGITTEEEEIKEYLGTEAASKAKKLTNAEREEMDKDITLEDIEDIVKNLKSDKSPGTTGFTNEFYKEFLKDINIWILNYIHYTYQEKGLSYMQRRGAITLIPKGQKDKSNLGNWRPITLLNTLYKLISAIIAKKIKKVLPRIIGHEQKGFVDGRNISDAIRRVYDTIDYANNNNKRGVMLAIDFRKAFDSIAFAFIKAVLRFFGFSTKLINWIMTLLKDFTVVIVQAGNISKTIDIERGCRQGDPIASLLFILCIEVLLIKIRTSEKIKPFKMEYQLHLTIKEIIQKYMEGFADDITLSIENTTESLMGATEVIEKFGDLSGLRINKEKTQAMVFGHESRQSNPAENNLGFEWVKEIKILGVTITCDLVHMELKNFNSKYEAIEKMLKHWTYRTLNLEGRITITKSLALPKLTHLATVLPELDNQKAKKMEDLTIKFIWRTFKDQATKKSVRVKLARAKIKPDRGGLGIMDIKQFWNAAKISWLRRLKTKEYTDIRTQNNLQEPTTDTEGWLRMLMCELIIISKDLNLTPHKILTSWGTEKIRTMGLKLKNKFWRTVFTELEDLEEGFYYTNPKYLGETVIWGTQSIKIDGRQLKAGGINSIAYGKTRDETGITTINHLITPTKTPNDIETGEKNKIKTREEIQIQTGKTLGEQEYRDIIKATQHYLQTKGTSLQNLPNPGIGPTLEGLTRMLGWMKKGSKHFYGWLRGSINIGELTKASEKKINTTLGTMQSLQFFRGIYKNVSKIKCNPAQKFQEQMITMHRQALNYIVSKDRKNNVEPECTFCTIGPINQRSEIEDHRHFYSDCIYVERYWTEIKIWASHEHNAEYKTRDRIYGKSNQHPYSIDNTLLRESRSTLWKCRQIKTLPNISSLKSKLKKQIPLLIIVQKDKTIKQGLEKLLRMAEN